MCMKQTPRMKMRNELRHLMNNVFINTVRGSATHISYYEIFILYLFMLKVLLNTYIFIYYNILKSRIRLIRMSELAQHLEDSIRQKLEEKFKLADLHIKHTAANCGVSFQVVVVSDDFKPMKLLERQ